MWEWLPTFVTRHKSSGSTGTGEPMTHRYERLGQDFLLFQMLFDDSPFIQVRSQGLFTNGTV